MKDKVSAPRHAAVPTTSPGTLRYVRPFAMSGQPGQMVDDLEAPRHTKAGLGHSFGTVGVQARSPVIQPKLKLGAVARGDGTGTSRKPQEDTTGLPEDLKSGIEHLSGYSMDDVKVHYHSDKPAQLHARAYAYGTDIHVASGQEKHLPHEAWHVVQQKQGRVKPILQMKETISLNDEQHLEKEADVMGKKALESTFSNEPGNAAFQGKQDALIIASVNTPTAQLIPDKADLYWERLKKQAGAQLPGTSLVNHLVTYIMNAPLHWVGQGVRDSVTTLIAAGAIVTMGNLLQAIRQGLQARLAAPGNYAGDTDYNRRLTKALESNPFIQSVMNGTLQGAVSGQRNAPPVGAAGVPLAISVPAGADDRILETIDLFNRLTDLSQNISVGVVPGVLPAVHVQPIRGPHAAMDENGSLDLGWAATRGSILHEFGHHLEHNLNPADLTTVHNFLTARTQAPAGGLGATPMAGMRQEAGYFFEHHPGYHIDMPPINAGGLAGRKRPRTRLQQFGYAVTTPYHIAEQGVGRAYHATPLRYLGLIGSSIQHQVGRLASGISRRREPRNWGAKGVENFFVYNANNQQLSYSTVTHDYERPGYEDTGSTEYLSTTVEFFNRPSHIRELVQIDPIRVALFLYLANRPQYNAIKNDYNALFPRYPAPRDLDDLIHAV